MAAHLDRTFFHRFVKTVKLNVDPAFFLQLSGDNTEGLGHAGVNGSTAAIDVTKMIEYRKIGRSKTDIHDADLLAGQVPLDDFAPVIHEQVQNASKRLEQHSHLVDVDFPGALTAVMLVEGDPVVTSQNLCETFMVAFEISDRKSGDHVDGHVDGRVPF